MKLALLSDAHGNAPALRACLAAAERCHPDTRYLPYREGTILRGLCERLMPWAGGGRGRKIPW